MARVIEFGQGCDIPAARLRPSAAELRGLAYDAEVKAAGGSATLSADGRYNRKPDVAIVIFGEDPYAEFQGDRPDVGYDDAKNLALLRPLP